MQCATNKSKSMLSMKRFFMVSLFLGAISFAFAASPTLIKVQLSWDEAPIAETDEWGMHTTEIWRFEGAIYDGAHPSLPYFYHGVPLDGYQKLEFVLTETEYEPFSKKASPDDEILSEEIVFQQSTTQERDRYHGKVWFIPIRKTGPNTFERLTRFTLEIRPVPAVPPFSPNRGGGATYTSVLSDGVVYKIAVSETGIYKIDYNFLVNELKLAPGSIDPRNIRLYGNGGGMLPELVSDTRYDDLVENAILAVGQEDGKLDAQDYFLFYGEGPSAWSYSNGSYEFQMNVYDTRNY